jgi:hypothetical protein
MTIVMLKIVTIVQDNHNHACMVPVNYNHEYMIHVFIVTMAMCTNT